METAYIILGVVAVLLVFGGLIAFLVVRSKKKTAKTEEQPAEEVAQPAKAETKSEKAKPAEAKPSEAKSVKADEPATEEAEAEEPEAEDKDEGDDEFTVIKPVFENGSARYIVIKYSKSFLAKLIQSGEETKNYYSQLKNKLLSYKGVKSRVSWKWETFRCGRKTLAKLRLRGKTLSLCLALNAEDYEDSKYIVENISDVKSYVDVPCLYRIKNDRRVKYAGELIEEVMRKNGIEAPLLTETADYVALHPYETTEALIERNLIKVLTDEDAQSGTMFKPRSSVTAQEVDSLMQDEVAATLIFKAEGKEGGKTDKTKQDIINIDTLSKCFESGETVTLEEIKKRVKGFNKKTTYIKVLARGTLDKPLTVEADSFSLQAVKMIVLTGGVAIKK